MVNIILIGFMGCGKSTVGRILAAETGAPLVDTDHFIEKQMGKTVSAIFESYGEAFFRQAETDCLRELLNGSEAGQIISVGGGLPMKEENRQMMKQLGKVCYLKTALPVIMARLQGDCSRPLLAQEQPAKRAEELLTVRHPVYEAAADIIIDTSDQDPQAIAQSILSVLCVTT
ncbi:MAG: shikimate kinase [Lachnospiraceae bacterium]|jgi:shikimate kinase|nr:shikimate kinase [Lachnospiraceae bacterium]